MDDPSIYISAGTAIAVIGYVVKITWTLSRIEKEIREDVEALIDNLQRDVVKLSMGGSDRAENIRHEFGETASAIRQKLHDVETWNRDNFVRKDSFELVIGRLEKSMEKLGDRFEDQLEKIVERIRG